MNEELVEYNVRFKDIDGYVGIYQITDDGRVFNKKYDRFLYRNFNCAHYSYISLYKNGARKSYLVHRLVANAFLDNPKNKLCVDHINGNITDNNVSNLRFATHSENLMNAHVRKNKKIQIKGVYKNRENFIGRISKDGIEITKTFKTLNEAKKWREQKEQEFQGEFAYKN